MENVFEHDAIPTWSGFIYQGRIAAYLAIKKIIELRDDNKVSEVDKYAIEMEKCEDIAIVYQCEKEKREYISIHQVKNEKENALGAYKKPLIQLMLEKGYYTKDNGDAPDAYLHIANRVRIQNKDFETEYLENIKNWKQKIFLSHFPCSAKLLSCIIITDIRSILYSKVSCSGGKNHE